MLSQQKFIYRVLELTDVEENSCVFDPVSRDIKISIVHPLSKGVISHILDEVFQEVGLVI
jgi:hypothetical protein